MLLRVVHIKELCAWWGSKRLQEKFHRNLTFTFLNDYLKVLTCWRMSTFFTSIWYLADTKWQSRKANTLPRWNSALCMTCNATFRNAIRSGRDFEKSHKSDLPGSIWPQNFSSLKMFILWKCSFDKDVLWVKCSFGENVHSVQGFWPSATHCFNYHTTLLLGSIIPE